MPCTSDDAQLPTPTIATRSFPSGVLLAGALGGAPLAGDQTVEPGDLALALVQPVVHQLDGVGVHALAGCPHRGAQVGQPLLEVAAPPLELVEAGLRPQV